MLLSRALLMAVVLEIAQYELCVRALTGTATAKLWYEVGLLPKLRRFQDIRGCAKLACFLALVVLSAAYKQAITREQVEHRPPVVQGEDMFCRFPTCTPTMVSAAQHAQFYNATHGEYTVSKTGQLTAPTIACTTEDQGGRLASHCIFVGLDTGKLATTYPVGVPIQYQAQVVNVSSARMTCTPRVGALNWDYREALHQLDSKLNVTDLHAGALGKLINGTIAAFEVYVDTWSFSNPVASGFNALGNTYVIRTREQEQPDSEEFIQDRQFVCGYASSLIGGHLHGKFTTKGWTMQLDNVTQHVDNLLAMAGPTLTDTDATDVSSVAAVLIPDGVEVLGSIQGYTSIAQTFVAAHDDDGLLLDIQCVLNSMRLAIRSPSSIWLAASNHEDEDIVVDIPLNITLTEVVLLQDAVLIGSVAWLAVTLGTLLSPWLLVLVWILIVFSRVGWGHRYFELTPISMAALAAPDNSSLADVLKGCSAGGKPLHGDATVSFDVTAPAELGASGQIKLVQGLEKVNKLRNIPYA